MDSTMKILIAMIVLTIVIAVIMFILKKVYFKKIITCLGTGEYEEFYELVNKRIVKALFARFNLEYFKLNAIVIEGNKRKINDQFDMLLDMKITKAQREEVTMKAFNYYVGMENRSRCKKLLDSISTFNNVRMLEEATITYDVFVQKKSNHIDELLERMESMPEPNRAIYEYLVSVQYANKGDEEKAKEYEELSKKHMDMPIQK